MSQPDDIALVTPTWAGDIDHFRVMRASLEQSPLANVPHYVVVQTEDLSEFEEFRGRSGLTLLTTRDVLPAEVEHRRVKARVLAKRFGRNFTRICGSLKRTLSWPSWPSYTGWHTQQLCKLKLARDLNVGTVVVIDSDVLVTPHANVDDFFSDSGVVCFARWQEKSKLEGKVRNWTVESERLVGAEANGSEVNVYFDTPFVLDRNLLTSALNHLESKSGKHWWSALLASPPRRWSEFGYYKTFLASTANQEVVQWREPWFFRYIRDTSNPSAVLESVDSYMCDPDVHYVTIHSESSGRHQWPAEDFLLPILADLRARHGGCSQ
ncbi:DUF6492 family protein [Marinobacter sp. CHS3-4]|uniref:DUF6492 family protein n=1 Tax=Marinobacter sp. CHS3-4 TaxID=3045174 RepID=UPI0024B5F178|nr:DUF6492 family protein [Marinobacter sp. CHS3-4]MDI9246696.1 DUF6492 family protein [Marinobacter sp. CHS3-4]